MNKPTLVYFNPDCFIDTDITVLHHLINDFRVIWFYAFQESSAMMYDLKVAVEYAEKYGICLEIVNPKMRRRDPRNYFIFSDVAKKINSYNPDLVYSCSVYPFWTFCYSKVHCKNKILGVHDVTMHSSKFNISNYLIHYQTMYWMKRFQYILTFSNNQNKFLREKLGKDSIMVGMSIKSFGNSFQKRCPIKEGVKLLFFGRIDKYKGLDILIETLEILRKKEAHHLKLTIAGNGRYWKDCENLIQHDELFDLKIRYILNEEIPDLMSSHHFLVLPYRNATQSGPLATALNYNLPIIAPNYGCFKDTYNESSAILYENGLLEGLQKVSFMSQNEYNDMQFHVTQLKEHYSEEIVADRYIKAFTDILKSLK